MLATSAMLNTTDGTRCENCDRAQGDRPHGLQQSSSDKSDPGHDDVGAGNAMTGGPLW